MSINTDKYRVAEYFDDYFKRWVSDELTYAEAEKLKNNMDEKYHNKNVYTSYEIRKVSNKS